jgi:hypothetical protein
LDCRASDKFASFRRDSDRCSKSKAGPPRVSWVFPRAIDKISAVDGDDRASTSGARPRTGLRSKSNRQKPASGAASRPSSPLNPSFRHRRGDDLSCAVGSLRRCASCWPRGAASEHSRRLWARRLVSRPRNRAPPPPRVTRLPRRPAWEGPPVESAERRQRPCRHLCPRI